METATEQIQVAIPPPQSIPEQEAAQYQDPIDREFVKSAVLLYHPGARPHPVEWLPDPIEGRLFLGCSSLVKGPAWDYADRILRKDDRPDEHEGFYGEQGNKLAEVHFNSLTPYQENQVRIPLSATRDLIGHIDGILVYDPLTGTNLSFAPPASWPTSIALRPLEHKHMDFDDGTEAGGKTDLAERQVVLACAMLKEHLGRTRTLIVPPDFNEDRIRPALPLQIPEHVTSIAVDRVGVHFWPRTSPRAKVISYTLAPEAMSSMLAYYRRKASAIEAAVAGNSADLTLAAWDVTPDGLQEFRLTPDARSVGIDPTQLLRISLEYEFAKRQAEHWEAEKQKRSALGCSILAEADTKTVEVHGPDGTVWAKPTSANTAHGKSKFLKPNLRGAWDDDRIKAALQPAEAVVGIGPQGHYHSLPAIEPPCHCDYMKAALA